ncbi:family 20 glycosylhydrolase [Hephaestia sp. GCM10023244]|uniref:family 20 glycosylhydrolase n=1 Tax=unclassified Hephaestia TaxID=2631281 RepID=UPI002077316E|nr:family 20 glycosylhydrolase [Hephaestia sp. MAHUQ-44]MCM8731219.1 family 20 glycosylhydrolase [Hephaestia sp. MAHUQ-44]
MRTIFAAAALSLILPAAGHTQSSLPLLPMPASVTPQNGFFTVAGAGIAVVDDGSLAAAGRLRSLVERTGGPDLALTRTGRIRFARDPAIKGAEAYRLVVTPTSATISASTDAGLFYGAETLWQLIAASKDGRIAAVTIDDTPAFAWRGVMLDSARHFQPPAYIMALIDRMAMAKLNTLHWHLTDDQAWRIEIDRYPKLTEVGAWRQPAGAAGVDAAGNPVRYGGFYTKAEIRDIVAYATQHHITIVPEIEMPGHATAPIAAYPTLASTSNPPTAPSHDWGILPNLYNADDATFTFLKHVLDEVMALFPGRYIHVGGDEAVKGQWKANPAIQAKITALGLKDENALQGWFTARIGAYLAKHDRKLIGWDEILDGAVPADATVMSWRGIDGAITAARAGHDTVLSPAPTLYFNYRQSVSPDEPGGPGELVDWRKLYAFDPAPAALTPAERKHILGLQGNLWTEHLSTTAYADRMMWPRAAILADMAWSSAPRDWDGLSDRLVAAFGRWQRMGLAYNVTPLVPLARFAGRGDAIEVVLDQPAGIGTVRVTTDGSAPTATSSAYTVPLKLAYGTIVRAQSFAGDVALGDEMRWAVTPDVLRTRAAAEMDLCSNAIPLRLEDDGVTDGVRRIHWVDIMKPCWIWKDAPLDGATRITAEVGQMPFNFAIGDDIKHITHEAPATPAGEFKVRRDSCDGPVIATVPLTAALASAGVTTVSGSIAPQPGTHDLCLTFAQTGIDPYWVLDRLTLGAPE